MNPVQTMIAEAVRNASQALAANLKAMPPDKQVWQPLDVGRSALSMVQECAVMNRFLANVLRDRKVPAVDHAQQSAAFAALDTPEKAIAELEAATAELAQAIEAFPEAHLQDTIELPMHNGMVVPFQRAMFMPFWHMTYHEGQIAYIQTLYGDKEMHG
jgi:uncharacterized damage-inducible protein DinB